MRLLLLLSALLTALSGVTGTRATAQPVLASARASIAAERSVAVAPVVVRFVAPGHITLPPLRLLPSAPMSAVVSRILYAERRRE